jgi:hypothetical protein
MFIYFRKYSNFNKETEKEKEKTGNEKKSVLLGCSLINRRGARLGVPHGSANSSAQREIGCGIARLVLLDG